MPPNDTFVPILKRRKLRLRQVEWQAGSRSALAAPKSPAAHMQGSHSRIRAATPGGGQSLTLNHLYSQLGSARLVAQCEVHRTPHLHGASLRFPRQTHQAAAQLQAGRGGRSGSQAGFPPWTCLGTPPSPSLVLHRGGIEAGHRGAAAEHAVERRAESWGLFPILLDLGGRLDLERGEVIGASSTSLDCAGGTDRSHPRGRHTLGLESVPGLENSRTGYSRLPGLQTARTPAPPSAQDPALGPSLPPAHPLGRGLVGHKLLREPLSCVCR